MDVADGTTPGDVAAMISPGLARVAVAGRITCNGDTQTIDLGRSIPGDCQLTILTAKDDDPESLYVLRHSAAHVMAEAICKLFPETKLVYGPPLEDGFYYDIDLPQSLTPDDFARIEQEMSRIVKEDRPFCRYELPRDEAMSKLRDEGSRYKIDNAERAEGDSCATPGWKPVHPLRGPQGATSSQHRHSVAQGARARRRARCAAARSAAHGRLLAGPSR